jgi:hypothetical protein
MNFWDFVLWFFWVFVFVAYLMVIFSIIGDIFRDSSLNGWLKALWMLFLIFVPFLTALIYLIARGPGMQKRYIRETAGTAGGASPTEEISKAKALLDSGAISQAEFDALKAKALAV